MPHRFGVPSHDGDFRRPRPFERFHSPPGARRAPGSLDVRKRGVPPHAHFGGLTMHSDEKRNGHIDRRSLLRGAGLAAGAAAATSAAAAGEAIAPAETAQPQHAGYRETESIKTYYRLTRL
jgi:hypothetical protein